MLHPSTKRLIDKLSEMTRKQRVAWTEGENATVVHDTEGYRVVLTPEPHTVLLTDTLGREIETCRAEEFADELDSHGRPYAKFVSELYREASRHARGTERAIQTLLAELDSVESAPVAEPDPVMVAPIVLPDATTDETAPLESETEITAAVANLADQINATQASDTAPATEEAPPPGAELELAAEPEPAILAAPEPEPVIVPYPVPVVPEPVIETVAAEPAPAAEAVVETPAPSMDVPEPAEEPGSFGTFGAFEPAMADAPAGEEVVTEAPEPQPEPAPATEPEAVAAPPSPQPEPPATAPAPATAPPTLAGPISLSAIPFGFGLGAAQREGTPVHPSTSAAPTPEPAPAEAGEPPKRILIDGTLDLPDFTPESLEADAQDAYPPPAPELGPLDLEGEPAPPAHEPGQPRRFNPWN
jgi:hypothetical protein